MRSTKISVSFGGDAGPLLWLVSTAAILVSAIMLMIAQAAVPPTQPLQLCVVGKELVNHGLKCPNKRDSDSCYTDYDVLFTATINGVKVDEWQETVREKGGRSWYGYSYSRCSQTSCAGPSFRARPEPEPKEGTLLVPVLSFSDLNIEGHANSALEKYCMAPKCEDDIGEACAQLNQAAQHIDPFWKSFRRDFESNQDALASSLDSVGGALCHNRKNEKTLKELKDLSGEVKSIDYSDKDKYDRIFKVESKIQGLQKRLKCPGADPAKPTPTSSPSSSSCPKGQTPSGPVFDLLEEGARQTIKSNPNSDAAKLAKRFINDEVGGLRESKFTACMPSEMTDLINSCRADSANCRKLCDALNRWGGIAAAGMSLAGELYNAEYAKGLGSNCLGMDFSNLQ